MPGYHRLRCNQHERLFPARPEPSQDDPERFVQCRESVARSLGVQREQLLTERHVFQKQFLTGVEQANCPADEVPERGHHSGKSYRKADRTLTASPSFYEVRKVLMRQEFDDAEPVLLILSVRLEIVFVFRSQDPTPLFPEFWFKTRDTQTIHSASVPLYSLLLFTGH